MHKLNCKIQSPQGLKESGSIVFEDQEELSEE